MTTQQVIWAQINPTPGIGPQMLIEADAHIDFVVSGLLLPTTSGNLTGTLSGGTAYVIGQRNVVPATSFTYTASQDTYVDMSSTQLLTFLPVNNGAGAPALTANSIRLGFVTTNGTQITGATTTGKDSLGNWMRNTTYASSCLLSDGSGTTTLANATLVAFPFGTGKELLDNDAMHSTSVNNTRITITHAGLYQVNCNITYNNITAAGAYYVQLNKNGSQAPGGSQGWTKAVTSDFPIPTLPWQGILASGDYLEMMGEQFSGATQTMVGGSFQATRIG